jgi:hypothetical protein
MAVDIICNTHPQTSISVTGVSVVNLMLKLETVCRGVVSSSNLMMQKVEPQALVNIVESQAPIDTVISRGGHRHLQIGRMLDIDPISEPPPQMYVSKVCKSVCQKGQEVVHSWLGSG